MARKKMKKGPTPKKAQGGKKRRVRLMVIPEPKEGTRSIIQYTGPGTLVMYGPGNLIMECGSCGVPLAEGVNVAQVQGIVLRCPNCGEYNETLA